MDIMITLKVEPYCHSCNDFEAHVVKLYATDVAGNDVMYDTIVKCEYAHRCDKVAKFIKEAENNDIQRVI